MTEAPQPFQAAAEATRGFVHLSVGGYRETRWPLPVEVPLADLMEALELGRPELAFIKIRDAGEGVIRVAWTLMLREAFDFVRRTDDLNALPADVREPLASLLRTAIRGKFTFGMAMHYAGPRSGGGVSQPLTALAPLFAASSTNSPTEQWLAILERSELARAALVDLGKWRNRRLAHGFVGNADEFASLFDHRSTGSTDWRTAWFGRTHLKGARLFQGDDFPPSSTRSSGCFGLSS